MKRTGPLLIALAAILWGVDGLLRRSLFTLQPITIVFYEHLIGTLILLPFLLRSWRGERLTRREWSAVVVIALLSGVLGTLFFTAALVKVNFIQFSVVLLIQKLQPVFAVLCAMLVLGERPSRRYLGWALLAIAAAYFVTFPNGQVATQSTGAVVAALFALGAAVAWGSSTAFSRYTLLHHSHTFITGLRFVLTTLIALPLVFALGAGSQLGDLSGRQLLLLVAIACSTGMVALWVYYRGLKTTPASVSTIIELLFPLTAVLIDFIVYDTVLEPTQYLAAVILLYAVYRVTRQPLATALPAESVAR